MAVHAQAPRVARRAPAKEAEAALRQRESGARRGRASNGVGHEEGVVGTVGGEE